MKMKFGAIFSFLLTILVLSVVTASMIIPVNDRAKENSIAPLKSPVIGENGGNWDLERVDFIHYAKPDSTGKPTKATNTCYKLMGVKWKSLPVNYIINPTNQDGLSYDFVVNTISSSAENWDSQTSSELFNNNYVVDYNSQYGVQDYKNSIVFGNYPEGNVIGVTSVWYTRVGKEIVEFDMLLNDNYQWGDATVDPSLMDLENIMTHELGHSIGLSDIYTDSCSSVTMYGYSNYGDVEKRSLENPDILGLQSMYGI